MRLHRLELEGIGPFRDRQVVDFDQLTSSGLFLIDGPTGAGKTTIIDSITFALFSALSGVSSTIDRLRSDYSDSTSKSEIILEFSVQGVRHQITRGIAHSFRKADGKESERKARQTLIQFAPDGSQAQTLTSAREIGVYIRDLLRISPEQFRQLVVLAQGEFAALLRMKPLERLGALRHLLGEGYYHDLQEELETQGKSAQEKINAARTRVAEFLTQIRGMVEEQVPAETLVRLLELAEEPLSGNREIITEVAEFFQELLQQAHEKLTASEAALQPIQEQFSQLRQTRSALSDYWNKRTDFEEARALLSEVFTVESTSDMESAEIKKLVAEMRERVGVLKPFVHWGEQSAEREEQRRTLERNVAASREALKNYIDEIAEYPNLIKTCQSDISRSEKATAGIESLEVQIEGLHSTLALLNDLIDMQESKEKALRNCEKAVRDRDAAKLVLTESELTFEKARNSQLEQRVSVLAAGLIPGEACLVCGSVEHPNPAQFVTDDHVFSDSDIALLQEDVVRAREIFEAQVEAVKDIESKVNSLNVTMSALEAKIGGASSASTAAQLQESESALLELTQIGAQLPDLITRLAELENELSSSHETLGDLQKTIDQAKEALITFDTQVAVKESELAELGISFEDLPAQLASLSDQIQKCESFLSASDALNHASAGVSPELRAIDALEFNERYEQVKGQNVQLLEEREMNVRNVTLAQQQVENLDSLIIKFRTEASKAVSLTEKLQPTVSLGNIVSATSVKNSLKLELESYALQLRFHHVLEAASHHLRTMSNGRLVLELDEESQRGAKTGLGIRVFDETTGESRSASSLSGGESFYASLALALGLADVVQSESGGVALETLFVDEGFGSLDTDTLERVLDELDQLKSGGRVIGVISHVSEMKDRFAERIVVERQSDNTSVITQI